MLPASAVWKPGHNLNSFNKTPVLTVLYQKPKQTTIETASDGILCFTLVLHNNYYISIYGTTYGVLF